MSWKYFFGRDQVSHDGFEVSAYEGRNDSCLKEPTIEVVYGKFVLEAVRQMFNESFRDIEAKKDITGMLNNGIIPDTLLQAKYSLMFDYETVEIDSAESCFAEIHQRNDRFHFIPICSFRGYSDQLNMSVREINSLSCDLTKLLVFISQILTKYYGPKNYLENIAEYSRQSILIEQINITCIGFIDSLKNGPVHKMEKEIIKFATQLTQLENIIRGTTIGDDNGHEMIRECVKNLKPLFCANLIPNSEAWIKVEDSRLLLSEERENWKKRVIWPLGEEIPGYYDEGELSQYSWILDSKPKGKELRLVINGEKYYFGIAQVEEEEWGDKVSPKKLVNYLKYQFQDKDELCKSITCPCSPQKKRLWLCERCLWFMRMIGPTGVSCRCKKTTTKKIKVYCNGCKTDKLAEEVRSDLIEYPPPAEITPEWDKTVIVYENHETIPLPKKFTIIFLGESGVGKSTLISGLGNYLNWPTFEEAKKNKMQVCIPLKFKVQRRGVDKKIIETIVTAGDPEDNENFNNTGQSVTQQPKIHEFTFQSNKIKVIDTPGLSDSRGAEQDKENLRLIRECIHNQKEIHAICIVLKSNDTRLKSEFKLAFQNLLSLFPKPALKNVFFFFTYASGTFFGIEYLTGPVKEMQKKIQDSHKETYSFEGENTCAVDSESFKFLLCKERGVKYSNRPEEDFDFCWNESAAQVKDFLTFIKTVKPIEKKITLAVHHLATTALSLEEFIRNSDQLTQRKRDNLVKESKIILNVARKWSMVTEYHRLITDLEHWSVDEFKESCRKCEKFLKNVNKNFTKEAFKRLKKENDLLMVKNATQITTLSDLVVICPSVPPTPPLSSPVVLPPPPCLLPLPLPKSKPFTIIFLGESGVGKSTLISGLGNYLNWPTFEEAKKNQMQICIPVEFKVQRKLEEGGFDETTVRAGDFEDNENFNDVGQSVTQKPKVHEFIFQNNTVKVIDTPGLSDTRGAEQDRKNLELIRECIHDQKEIHAICIVLKSNDTRLTSEFKLAFQNLLSLFPKSALKNVFFFFTYARGTYFGIGDILNPLKELQQKFRDSHGVSFEFEGRNMCPVDSESFRYLLCKEQGIKYSSSAEERFEYCWNETAKQICDFLNFIKTVKPIEKKTTLAVHHLVTTALRLEEFIRTSDQLTLEQKDSLVKESKIIMSTARKYSMVTEYPRLTTDMTNWKIEEFCKSCDQCEKIVKTADRRLSEDISEHVKKTGYLLQSHNEAEKFNHEDKHGISQPKIEEVVNNSKQPPIANTDQQNQEGDISSFEIIDNDEDKKVPTETSSTENDTIGQNSKENGTSASSLPITTKSPSIEKPEMSPPLAEVTPEWDNIITVHTEHETIPVLIVPSPPAVTEGWNKIITEYTEHDTMPFTVAPPSPPQEFTVIFLGESGVGKSTLISGLGNYLNWPTFEEAKKNQMHTCIPLQFKVQYRRTDGKIERNMVKAGGKFENENFNDIGQSVTQQPKIHEFTFQSNKIKVIDTPGLSDSRDAEQDAKNLEMIRECVHQQDQIHAICIVLKSNDTRLKSEFKLAFQNFLSLFPKSALRNVFFFFTYASETFFEIGDILYPLKELQQKFKDSHGVSFEFEGRNMCPVDSESFRYLLCKEQGIKYSSSAEERFEYCWNETAKQVLDFLAFLKSVDPLDVEKIKAAHELVRTALELEEFLRTDKTLRKGLSEGARALLKKRADPLFYIARNLTMVPEYYRLKTEIVEFDSTSVAKSMYELLPVVKNSNVLHDGLSKFAENVSLLKGNNS